VNKIIAGFELHNGVMLTREKRKWNFFDCRNSSIIDFEPVVGSFGTLLISSA
jgi:hypothetical protein